MERYSLSFYSYRKQLMIKALYYTINSVMMKEASALLLCMHAA